jgi:hypothetical protein
VARLNSIEKVKAHAKAAEMLGTGGLGYTSGLVVAASPIKPCTWRMALLLGRQFCITVAIWRVTFRIHQA